MPVSQRESEVRGGLPGPRGWLIYAVAWTPVVLLYALATRNHADLPFIYLLLSAIVVIGAAAVGGVLVWMATTRLESLPWQRLLPLHLGLAALYALGWTAVQAGWIWLVGGSTIARAVMRVAGIWQSFTGLWIYALIVGVAYLVRTAERLRERELAATRAELAAMRARLDVVRSQLNPHFLFNSLHSLSALIPRDPALAGEAVERLGELLRYALEYRVADLVRLEDELDFAENYLELEALRFGDRLGYEIGVEPEARRVLVPPFILQPLIENSIRHGLAPRPGGGMVRIYGRLSGRELEVGVEDDGTGIGDAGLGLGLDGVRTLLEVHYGSAARFEAGPAPTGGFSVAIVVPAQREEATDAGSK